MDFNVHVCLLSFGRNLAFSLIDLMFYLSLRLTNDIREVFRLDQVIQEVFIYTTFSSNHGTYSSQKELILKKIVQSSSKMQKLQFIFLYQRMLSFKNV